MEIITVPVVMVEEVVLLVERVFTESPVLSVLDSSAATVVDDRRLESAMRVAIIITRESETNRQYL